MNLFQRLFAIIPLIINLLAKVFLRVSGLLGGLIVGILFIIYIHVFSWPISLAWYWILLIGLAAGAVLPRYFFFFSSAPLLFSESGYERYERGELTQKEKEARQNGCMIGIVTGLYSLACGVVILGCMSWLLSDDGPPTLIFRITLIIQLLYAGIVPFLAIHFEPEFSPT